jgi:hypothetical protein
MAMMLLESGKREAAQGSEEIRLVYHEEVRLFWTSHVPQMNPKVQVRKNQYLHGESGQNGTSSPS